MRRTKHRRRFHTERLIRNRQRAYERESPPWWGSWRRELEAGRLADRNAYFGCGGSHCLLCHWDKLTEPRRIREKRAWRAEAEEQLSAS